MRALFLGEGNSDLGSQNTMSGFRLGAIGELFFGILRDKVDPSYQDENPAFLNPECWMQILSKQDFHNFVPKKDPRAPKSSTPKLEKKFSKTQQSLVALAVKMVHYAKENGFDFCVFFKDADQSKSTELLDALQAGFRSYGHVALVPQPTSEVWLISGYLKDHPSQMRGELKDAILEDYVTGNDNSNRSGKRILGKLLHGKDGEPTGAEESEIVSCMLENRTWEKVELPSFCCAVDQIEEVAAEIGNYRYGSVETETI